MNRPTAMYLDVQCPWSHRAWRWLSLLPERTTVEVRPYWTGAARRDGGRASPWERDGTDWALEVLALGELARESGSATHRAFVDAAFARARPRRAAATDPETWLALCAEVGIDLGRFADDGERWRAEVGLWHQEAQDRYGVRRTPTLLLDERWPLLVRLREDVPDPAAARRLMDQLLLAVERPLSAAGRG